MRTVGLVIAALLLSSHSALAAKETVAIHPLQPLGTEQEIVDRLESMLHGEVDRLGTVNLQDRNTTLDVVTKATGSGAGCEGELRCLLDIGKKCGVDKLIYGTVATLGDSYVLDLKLIDINKGKLVRRHSIPLSGKKDVLIEGVRAVATQLIAPERYVGNIELRLAKPGAEVYVDGVLAGTTPMSKPVTGLSPGKHGLKIVLKGFKDFDRFVEVRFGRTTVVNVALSGDTIDATIAADPNAPVEPAPVVVVQEGSGAAPAEPGPMESPLFLSGLGTAALGGAAVIVGGVAFAGFGMAYGSMDANSRDVGHKRVVGSSKDPSAETAKSEINTFERDYQNAQIWWNVAWISLGTGLAVAATGGALMGWDLLSRPSEVESTMAVE